MQYEYRFIASVPQKLLDGRRQTFEIESLSLDEDQHLLEVVVSCRKAFAKPDAALNGDPAAPSDNRRTTVRPQSVS